MTQIVERKGNVWGSPSSWVSAPVQPFFPSLANPQAQLLFWFLWVYSDSLAAIVSPEGKREAVTGKRREWEHWPAVARVVPMSSSLAVKKNPQTKKNFSSHINHREVILQKTPYKSDRVLGKDSWF